MNKTELWVKSPVIFANFVFSGSPPYKEFPGELDLKAIREYHYPAPDVKFGDAVNAVFYGLFGNRFGHKAPVEEKSEPVPGRRFYEVVFAAPVAKANKPFQDALNRTHSATSTLVAAVSYKFDVDVIFDKTDPVLLRGCFFQHAPSLAPNGGNNLVVPVSVDQVIDPKGVLEHHGKTPPPESDSEKRGVVK